MERLEAAIAKGIELHLERCSKTLGKRRAARRLSARANITRARVLDDEIANATPLNAADPAPLWPRAFGPVEHARDDLSGLFLVRSSHDDVFAAAVFALGVSRAGALADYLSAHFAQVRPRLRKLRRRGTRSRAELDERSHLMSLAGLSRRLEDVLAGVPSSGPVDEWCSAHHAAICAGLERVRTSSSTYRGVTEALLVASADTRSLGRATLARSLVALLSGPMTLTDLRDVTRDVVVSVAGARTTSSLVHAQRRFVLESPRARQLAAVLWSGGPTALIECAREHRSRGRARARVGVDRSRTPSSSCERAHLVATGRSRGGVRGGVGRPRYRPMWRSGASGHRAGGRDFR